LIAYGVATLTEMRTSYYLNDLLDANDALDARLEIEAGPMKTTTKGRG
jgi:hypothetical protein